MSECYLCKRIDTDTYYNELRELGFPRDDSLRCVNYIKSVYEKNPIFCCGKSSKVLKATFAYITATCFYQSNMRRYTQLELAEFFGTHENNIRNYYKKIIDILKISAVGGE